MELGTKVDGAHRDVALCKHLLPAICHFEVDCYTFQQDSAPAHLARDKVELLRRGTPDFIAPDLRPPNSRDLYPVDYWIWGVLQERVYQQRFWDVDELRRRLIDWSGM